MDKKPTILLTDDDPQILKLYQTKLENDGFQVLIARDGQECLETAQTLKPDLILLDMLMPKTTGPGVLMQLKQNPNTKAIPVLVLTNLDHDQNSATATSLGAAGYLLKQDTDPAKLSAKIREVLSPSPAVGKN